MSHPTRVAVVGVGYFGRFHAQHYKANPRAELVAVVDIDAARARAVGQEFGAEALFDHRALAGRVDAASIAVPTANHFEVARDLLGQGIHLLVEKPLTDNVETAAQLAELAGARGRLLQVGHVERYSAPFRALSELITRPLYIESYRIAPWKERAHDVDVVLDLMIHDIDLILGLVRAPVATVHSVGAPILTPNEDLANARIVFENGCVAVTTASRISFKTERRMRIFQPNSYIICDFAESQIISARRKDDPALRGPRAIDIAKTDIPKEDSLANEIDSFLACVADGGRPMVDGRAACDTLHVARLINESMREHRHRIEAMLAAE